MKNKIILFLCLALLGSVKAQTEQLLSQGKAVNVSSVSGDYTGAKAVDGIVDSRWSSAATNPQWIKVDLGASYSLTRMVLNWERASAESYYILVSNQNITPDPANAAWLKLVTKAGMPDAARIDLLTASGSYRYIAMYGYNKLHPWGYSLWEFQVYGTTGNLPPTANAGSDQTLATTATSATLTGTGYDPDGTITSYTWTKTSGGVATIVNPTSASTSVTGLAAGSYTFRLTVTDNAGTIGYDDMIVTIPSAQCAMISLRKPAVASSVEGANTADNAVDAFTTTRWGSAYTEAEWIRIDLQTTYSICEVRLSWEGAFGKNYEIRLGSTTDINSSQLIGTVTNGDGGADQVTTDRTKTGRYIWMKGLLRGTGYGYSLWDMQVYGISSAPVNIAPIANAGIDQTISLPISTANLSGSASTDPDGSITSYIWTKVSGPAGGTIATPNTATTSVSALVQGVYVFRLTVTDNGGKTHTDDIQVTMANTACTLLSQGKTATSSSSEGGMPASAAVDGNIGTRWGSAFADPQWIMIDLGASYAICSVELTWEAASGKAYQIQLSNDASFASFNTIATITNGDGGIDNVTTDQTKTGRYIRMYGTVRNTGYGYSLWEFKVNGTSGGGGSDIQAPTAPTNLAASPATYAVFLLWQPATDNVGVTYYKVFKGTNLESTVEGATNTSMTVSGLTPNTSYTFSVRAYDAANNESPAATVTTKTQIVVIDTSAVNGIGNIAIQMPTTHSSIVAGSGNVSANAVDANLGSRWESAFTDNEWMSIDLGLRYNIGRVILRWEAASAKQYQIQVSNDNVNWTTAYDFNPTAVLPVLPRVDDLVFASKTGRYIKMKGIARNTGWSYSLFEFEVYSPGSGPDDIPNPNPNPNPAPVPPGPASFNVSSPASGAMITNTRRPSLSWNAMSGATSYEVWVNVTQTNYDWFAMGSLLDRFTKLGTVTTTSYTLQQDLSDRWTYKWYIVAKTSSSDKYSNLGVFSLYIPVLETVADGINIINGCRDLNRSGSIDPYEDWHNTIDTRVADLMSRITIEEKAYQMFYNAQAYPQSGWAFGPGSVNDMFNKQKLSAATRLGIPFVSCGDDIHGYSTTFPTQSTIAASRNVGLAYSCANMQRIEQNAVGARGVLGPLAEVGTKVLYPRIQEGNGEDADFAAAMVRAMVCGFQAGPELNPKSVLVTTKHWPGEGAGGEALITYDAITVKYHMRPWFANVDAGAGSVMPGYAGSSYIDPGGPGAGDSKKILDYLRNVVKFDGAICTDWLPWSAWANAANAGADIMGGADPGAEGFTVSGFLASVPASRINQAVERILRIKFKLGVFEEPYGDPVNGPNAFFTPENQTLAIDAARQSMTLMKNNGVLPLNMASGSRLLVTGARANDGDSYRIWTSYFHREYGAKTMYEAIRDKGTTKGINVFLDNAISPQAAIVIVGEPTYTHGTMYDKEMPWIHDAYYAIQNKYEYDLTALNQVKAMGIPMVVVVVMPRPFILQSIIDMADALIIAYRPGDGGGPALAQILFGEYAPKGKLPWQLPRSMDQVGTDVITNQLERWDIPFDLGATPAEIQAIRAKIAKGELIQPIYGNPQYQYGYGIQGFTKEAEGNIEQSVKTGSAIEFALYPNPSSGNVILEMEGELQNSASVSVYTLSGTEVTNVVLPSGTKYLPIEASQWAEGIYVVQVKTGENIRIEKFMKK